jgi:Uma2 family endonuclease
LFELCQINRDLFIQRDTKTGNLVIMTPAGGETGNRNLSLGAQLYLWTEQDGTGVAFDSSTGFLLPGASKEPMSPDAAWMSLERWNSLTSEQKIKFPPICPDFVVELRSPSDTVVSLQRKMREWIQLGAKLGWLIDRQNRRVYIYRSDGSEDCLDNPATVSGAPILPGFVLELRKIW